MNIRLGEKIRTLRKIKNISQETLARYLGVSFQAVSKWENGSAMPDVMMIPAIASFFEVSTDELFDYNTYETERKVQQACWKIAEIRETEPEQAEKELRALLKKYPGNEVILNNLIYSLKINKKYDELIDICKALIESSKYDDCRYDAARILAETYKELGEYVLCKDAIDQIPEFFFSHREQKALLLEGEDMFLPAWQEKAQSAETLVRMILRIADYYKAASDMENVRCQLLQAKAIVELLEDDLTPPFWKSNIYEYPLKDYLGLINDRLSRV